MHNAHGRDDGNSRRGHAASLATYGEPIRRDGSRGVYGGAVGYIGFDGDMDLCIAIRTVHLRDQQVHVQAGAGIVADSDPASEWQETLNKAAALLTALR